MITAKGAVLAVLACSAIVASAPEGRVVDGVGEPEVGAYAYITERELVVMRGPRIIARVSRLFDPGDPNSNKVVWTVSGRYVALLSDARLRQEDATTEELIFVDVRDGTVNRVLCPNCYDLTPINSNSILVATHGTSSNGPSRFLKFILTPELLGPADVDTSSSIHLLPHLLASSRDYLLTRATTHTSEGYRERLEVIKEDGTSHILLGLFDSNHAMHAAVWEDEQAGLARIAVAFRENPGECVARFPVVIFELTSGGLQVSDTDLSAAEPTTFHREMRGIEVEDLSWGADGRLSATVASWGCKRSERLWEDKVKIESRPSEAWELEGAKWVRADVGRATMLRNLDDHAKVVLEKPDCNRRLQDIPNFVIYCNTGQLYEIRDGVRRDIAAGVIGISSEGQFG